MQTQYSDFQLRVLAVLDRRLAGTISNREAVEELRNLFKEEGDIEAQLDEIIKSVSKRETKPFRIPKLRLADGAMAPKVDSALWRFWVDLGLGLSPYAEIGPGFIEAMECDFGRPEQPFADY